MAALFPHISASLLKAVAPMLSFKCSLQDKWNRYVIAQRIGSALCKWSSMPLPRSNGQEFYARAEILLANQALTTRVLNDVQWSDLLKAMTYYESVRSLSPEVSPDLLSAVKHSVTPVILKGHDQWFEKYKDISVKSIETAFFVLECADRLRVTHTLVASVMPESQIKTWESRQQQVTNWVKQIDDIVENKLPATFEEQRRWRQCVQALTCQLQNVQAGPTII